MKNLKYWLGLLLVTATGLGIGIAYNEMNKVSSTNAETYSDTMIPNPLPDNIEHLVKSADIIIVGKVGDVVNTEIFYGYGPEAEELSKQDEETSALLGLPIVDYEITVEEVILGTNDLEKNSTILFRMPGASEPENRDTDFIEEGQQKLLFLTANPDGTYGISSFMHLMSIEGEAIHYYFEGEKRSPFGFEIRNASQFIGLVKQVVAEQVSSNGKIYAN